MEDRSTEIPALIEQSDRFERCADCGTYLVQLSNHRCRSNADGTRSPNRAERRRRARGDARDDETLVGIFSWSANTYAYHDVKDGQPLCGCLHRAGTAEFEVVTLASAKSRGRSPCRNCRRLR